jgi:hypothetical protein
VTDVQATVASWSGTTRGGSVLLDDGTMLDFDHTVFEHSGLRLLRFGQRVRLRVEDIDGRPRIAALTLATLPWPDDQGRGDTTR